jgi:HNH endonuclease
MSGIATTITTHEPHTGACGCGCRGRTNVARRTRRDRGWIKGEHIRYIKGHHLRNAGPRYAEVDTGYETPRWIWQRAKLACGYGRVWDGKGVVFAHRYFYECEQGPVPEGLEIDHLCRRKDCVRPGHLEAVTHAQNCQRGALAKLTPEQVAEIRASSETQRVIARQYGITQGHVARIRRGETWCP